MTSRYINIISAIFISMVLVFAFKFASIIIIIGCIVYVFIEYNKVYNDEYTYRNKSKLDYLLKKKLDLIKERNIYVELSKANYDFKQNIDDINIKIKELDKKIRKIL